MSAETPRPRRSFANLLTAMPFVVASPWLAADLAAYVKAPDASYGWTVEHSMDMPGVGSVDVLRLTSQTWRDIEWKHWLTVFRPAEIRRPEHALLVISGGSSRSEAPRRLAGEQLVIARIGQQTGSVVAILGQVPNQPLLGGLHEDALIAHTFQKYLETRDATWPCLLPMTKSAVRAMDAVQEIVREKHSQSLSKFTVTGASKRGWTTWLTGAVDPRVAAIAPMVIDTLNIPEQMKLHKLSFGRYSEQIHDYSDLGLPDRLADPRSKPLVDMVDPYSYREKLTMPKLIVLGTNDRYWPVDAIKLYFDELPGEKHIHYVPNRGHGLGPGAIEAITAFYHSVIEGRERPRLEWKLARGDKEATLRIASREKPRRAELYHARAATRDFRNARWEAAPMASGEAGEYRAALPIPEKEYLALFGSLTYPSDASGEYAFSTSIEVIEPRGSGLGEARGGPAGAAAGAGS
ncbi:MAG: PhoPQ-activated pathogenicity-like protein PqaA type [Planctomycetes bacterium]|nr:PhoPQ-activated pathogenicity-like protein PqaA type [Planctomycetota bacterium]